MKNAPISFGSAKPFCPGFELYPGVDDYVLCFQNVGEAGSGKLGGGLEFFEHFGGDFDRRWVVVAGAVETVPDVTACVLARDNFADLRKA